MKVDVLLGLQWADEFKANLVGPDRLQTIMK